MGKSALRGEASFETFRTGKRTHSMETGSRQDNTDLRGKESQKHVIEAKVPRIHAMAHDNDGIQSGEASKLLVRAAEASNRERRVSEERRLDSEMARFGTRANPFANMRLAEESRSLRGSQKAMARSFAGNTLTELLGDSRPQKKSELEPLVLMRRSTDHGKPPTRHSVIQSQIMRLKAAAKRKESKK